MLKTYPKQHHHCEIKDSFIVTAAAHGPLPIRSIVAGTALHVATDLNGDAHIQYTQRHTRAGTGSADKSTTDISARVTGVDKATATEVCDAPHRWHADWKALAAAEASTDLRLPWLNRERGSCFIHGQKDSGERGAPPPAQEGRGYSHTSKSAFAWAGMGAEGWRGTCMGCGCQRTTLQSSTHTHTLVLCWSAFMLRL